MLALPCIWCHYVSAVAAIRSLSRELYRQTRGQPGHSAESRKSFEQRDVRYIDDLFFGFLCKLVFTMRCYASVVYAMALCSSVHLSVCPSLTSQFSVKTSKHIITQTLPHNSLGILKVKYRGNSPMEFPQIGGAKYT